MARLRGLQSPTSGLLRLQMLPALLSKTRRVIRVCCRCHGPAIECLEAASGVSRLRMLRLHPPSFPEEANQRLNAQLNIPPLLIKTDWQYERSGARQHYVIEAWVYNQRAGHAHGWFEPGVRLVLEKIEITRSQRSRGYGTEMIEQLRLKARETGCREVLVQNVRAGNSGAIKLYASMGGVPVQTAEEMYSFVITPP